MTTASPLDRALDTMLQYAAEWSGFHPEAVARAGVRRALEHELARGATLADLLRRAAERDPALVKIMRVAVGVRETFFFRHPEQFEAVATRIPALAAQGVIRAWSAGCATGEEAWSLAATIVANVPGQVADPAQTLVLGTDLHAPSVEAARAGEYRANSLRPSGRLLYPLLTGSGDRLQVRNELRPITSFAVHDLQDPPPGDFEIIFCRNVLIYFTRAAARVILANLAAALTQGGLLVFGTIDVDPADLPQLVRVGRPETMMFTTRPTARPRPRPPSLQPPPRRGPTLPPSPPLAKAHALHRSALTWIERGASSAAEKVLIELNRTFPDYVPGILERALLYLRKNDGATTAAFMMEILRLTEGLSPDESVPGLEELPVAFYRDTASSYLQRAQKP